MIRLTGRRWWTYVLSGIILLGLIAGTLYAFPLLKVQSIEVEGNHHLSAEEIIDASAIHTGENVLRVHTAAAAHAVADLPWIRSATVGHNGVSTIHITVEENAAFVYSQQPDGAHIANKQGQLFVISTPPEGAVRIDGMGKDDPKVYVAVATALRAVEDLNAERLHDIEFVEARSPYEISLHFHDNKVVYWGSSEDAENKARATLAVLLRPEKQWNVTNPGLVTAR